MAEGEQMKTISLEPNYQNVFKRFNDCAAAELMRLSRKRTPTRSEVYAFVSALRVALVSIHSQESLEQLRASLDNGAVAMFEQVQKDQEDNG